MSTIFYRAVEAVRKLINRVWSKMEKAKILNIGKTQKVILPKVYFSTPNEIIFQEHELGVLLIHPEKRWKMLEEVIGSMEDDFFAEGRNVEAWAKRIKLK